MPPAQTSRAVEASKFSFGIVTRSAIRPLTVLRSKPGAGSLKVNCSWESFEDRASHFYLGRRSVKIWDGKTNKQNKVTNSTKAGNNFLLGTLALDKVGFFLRGKLEG